MGVELMVDGRAEVLTEAPVLRSSPTAEGGREDREGGKGFSLFSLLFNSVFASFATFCSNPVCPIGGIRAIRPSSVALRRMDGQLLRCLRLCVLCISVVKFLIPE